LRLASKCNHAVTPLVAVVLLGCCPTAIPGLVIPIVINAVELKSFLPATCQGPVTERNKLVPLIADFYTTKTVVFIITSVWVFATLEHSVPCPIYGMECFLPCHPMHGFHFGCTLSLITAARRCMGRNEVTASNVRLIPTVASATPDNTSVFSLPGIVQHHQPAKSLARQIFYFCHFFFINLDTDTIDTSGSIFLYISGSAG